jgi:hypothetical protein
MTTLDKCSSLTCVSGPGGGASAGSGGNGGGFVNGFMTDAGKGADGLYLKTPVDPTSLF